jgi:hypothetical protein
LVTELLSIAEKPVRAVAVVAAFVVAVAKASHQAQGQASYQKANHDPTIRSAAFSGNGGAGLSLPANK